MNPPPGSIRPYQIRNNGRVLAGELIRARREAHGLTQARLARRAGTTQAAISRLETGGVSPTFETLADVLVAMGERVEPRARAIDVEGDPRRLAALRARPPAERVELAFSWNRLAGEIARAGTRARARP